MAKYATLNDAMVAEDELGEAERRYQLLAEVFEEEPKLRSQLHPALVSVKAEIVQLRALAPKDKSAEVEKSGKVVAFDAARFQKSG